MARIVLEDGEEVVKRKVGSDGRLTLTAYKNRKVTIIIHKEEE